MPRMPLHATQTTLQKAKQAVLQIIKYLLGTKDLCLTFKRGSDLDLSVYTNSNYAEKADDRRSVSGVVVTPVSYTHLTLPTILLV